MLTAALVSVGNLGEQFIWDVLQDVGNPTCDQLWCEAKGNGHIKPLIDPCRVVAVNCALYLVGQQIFVGGAFMANGEVVQFEFLCSEAILEICIKTLGFFGVPL